MPKVAKKPCVNCGGPKESGNQKLCEACKLLSPWHRCERQRTYHREYYLRRKYGITLEEYDKLLAEQGGGCAVCGEPSPEQSRALDVDHDHLTLKVRGLLCRRCNLLIGKVHDNPTVLRRAADYLETH